MFDTYLFDSKEINRKLDKIMTALDDLNSEITTLTTSINSEISALSAAQASNNDAGIEQAVTNLKALNTQLQASLNPTATPAS